ncbi:MAG TPA: signal peptidase II [Puia sp.]|jgi:signal peptidase II|nr:signal peptidase II [Puia sp.]
MKQLFWGKKAMKVGVFCLLSLSLISWDKVSKDLAKIHLRDQPVRSYLDDTFRLMYVENTGAAMSFADNLNPRLGFWLLGILPLVILLGLFTYVVLNVHEMRMARMVGFSLIFAGGLGNILDRLVFDRHVTDFMNLGIQNFRTGIFNFADLWITAGVVSLLVWRGGRPAENPMDSTGQHV